MASRPGGSSLFDTEAVTPSSKKKLTAAKFKLLARACIDNDLGAGSVYRVLFYAVEKAGAGGRFWKKNGDIADDLGIHRTTVIEALNKLTLGGYIERIGQHGKLGHRCNVYRITLDLGVAMRAAKREGRRRTKYPREQAGNSTGKPPPRGSETTTLGVVNPLPQGSSNGYTISTLPMNPSLDSLGSAPLESKKQVVQQGSDEGFEGVASIGEVIASGTIPPGKPSPPIHDTFEPSTSSPDEPLSSTLTVNRPIPGAEGPDHAQRSLGPMLVITGGLEKADTEDLGYDDPNLRPLKAAKKSAVDVLGMNKFLKRDLLLNHYLKAVPADAQDGVRALEYIEWAKELVEEQHAAICTSTSAASGGAA